MSLRHVLKHTATAVALAACVLAASGVRAAPYGDDLAASGLLAFSPPVSAPCHPSLGACPKPERPAATGRARVYPVDRWIDPVSAPCHPALKACRSEL